MTNAANVAFAVTFTVGSYFTFAQHKEEVTLAAPSTTTTTIAQAATIPDVSAERVVPARAAYVTTPPSLRPKLIPSTTTTIKEPRVNEAEAGKQLAADNAAALAKYKTATAEAAPVPTPTPTPAPTPSGEAMPTGDIFRSDGSMVWKHAFADDFTTNANEGEFLTKYATKFRAYPLEYRDTWTQSHADRNGRYDPNIISVADSIMTYNMRYQDGMHKVAAVLPMLPGKNSGVGWTDGQLYQRLAIRFRSDPLPGYKTAFLTWPTTIAAGKTSAWPWNGEIDFLEGNLDGASDMALFMHRQNATSNHDQDYRAYGKTAPQWHTYLLDWNNGYCAVYLDGKMIGEPIRDRVPNTPMKTVLQAETNLDGRQIPNQTTKGRVQVDWISIWTPA